MTVHSTSTLVVLLLVSGILQGQVKDQFQDNNNALTTIVVKEDAADDMEILNDQFDLDEVGMHQVIRITTRPEATPKPAEATGTNIATPSPAPQLVPATTPISVENPVADEPILASVEKTASPEVPETEINIESKVEEETISEAANEESIKQAVAPLESLTDAVTTNVPSNIQAVAPRSYSAPTSYSSSSTNSSKKTFKTFNKRFKKQKRKRTPKRKKRNRKCYKF